MEPSACVHCKSVCVHVRRDTLTVSLSVDQGFERALKKNGQPPRKYRSHRRMSRRGGSVDASSVTNHWEQY
jgi:hypothetical protein